MTMTRITYLGSAGRGASFLGSSVISTSVVSTSAAIEAEFSRALIVTCATLEAAAAAADIFRKRIQSADKNNKIHAKQKDHR